MEAAPNAVRHREAERRSRNRNGSGARPEQLLRVAVEVDRQLEQLDPRRRPRNRNEEVEHDRPPRRPGERA